MDFASQNSALYEENSTLPEDLYEKYWTALQNELRKLFDEDPRNISLLSFLKKEDEEAYTK